MNLLSFATYCVFDSGPLTPLSLSVFSLREVGEIMFTLQGCGRMCVEAGAVEAGALRLATNAIVFPH